MKTIIKSKVLILLCWLMAGSNTAVADGFACEDEHCQAQMRELKRYAKYGEPSANFVMGYAHLYGQGVELDYEKSYKYFKKAAKKGSSMAKYQLAVMLRQGMGVEVDEEKSMYYLIKAKDKGIAAAQTDYAVYLLTEENILQDQLLEAFQLLHAASDSDDARASYLLAKLYLNDQYIDPNPEKARHYMELAAAKNFADSSDLLDDIDGDDIQVAAQQPSNMEVITVYADTVEFVDLLDYVVRQAKSMSTYDGKATGTNLHGSSCAERGLCSSVGGPNHVEVWMMRNSRGMWAQTGWRPNGQ